MCVVLVCARLCVSACGVSGLCVSVCGVGVCKVFECARLRVSV